MIKLIKIQARNLKISKNILLNNNNIRINHKKNNKFNNLKLKINKNINKYKINKSQK